MLIPEFRYRTSLVFGDSDWHSVAELGQLGLSEIDPLIFYIGQTTPSPIRYSSFTKIKAPWLWRYGFNSANAGDFYGTSTGSNNSTAIGSLGVNVTNNTWYNVLEGTTVCEGYITSGSDGSVRTPLTRVKFYSYNDWYFEPSITYPTTSTNRGMTIRFLANYVPDLPSNMYSISNGVVTWNTTHPIYILLQGQPCIPY